MPYLVLLDRQLLQPVGGRGVHHEQHGSRPAVGDRDLGLPQLVQECLVLGRHRRDVEIGRDLAEVEILAELSSFLFEGQPGEEVVDPFGYGQGGISIDGSNHGRVSFSVVVEHEVVVGSVRICAKIASSVRNTATVASAE